MPELTTTLTYSNHWFIRGRQVHGRWDSGNEYVGFWDDTVYNDYAYGAVAIEYTIPVISGQIEPHTITIPISFADTGSNLRAILSTSAPSTTIANWRFGPQDSTGSFSAEITFGYNTTVLTFDVRNLSWLNSEKIYLYLYDINRGYQSYLVNYVYLSGTKSDATLEYIPCSTLSISRSPDGGSTVTVLRQSSDYAGTGAINHGAALYTGDNLKISATPADKYMIRSITVNGTAFPNGNTHTVSGNVAIVSIAQMLASEVGATDANIESSSTITVTKYDGTYVHSLQYSFGNISGYITASGGLSSSEVKFSNTSVSFTVPSSFYAQIPSAQSGMCTITCNTYASESSTIRLGDPTTCTFTATASPERCAPIVSGAVIDTNADTTALTGSNTKIVRYMSNALCTINATARNSSTIAEKRIGGAVVSGTTRTISGDDLTSSSFSFSATDSRGFTGVANVATDWIDYVKLTFNPVLYRPSPTANSVSLTFSGSMYVGSWQNSTPNAVTIQYQYKLAGASNYSALRTITGGYTPTASTSTYKSSSPIQMLDSNGSSTGFDYRSAYVFRFIVTDGDGTHVCSTVTKEITVGKGVPVFDWGENDFRFNVPIKIGDTQLTEAQLIQLLALLSN